MRIPASPLSRVFDAAANGPDLLRRLSSLLPRVVSLLDTADQLAARVGRLLDRLEQCETRVGAVIARVDDSERAAHAVIDRVSGLTARAEKIVADYEPVLQQLRGTADRAGARIGPEQVDALVAYLDFLPMVQTIDRELVPTLATLQSVAPDLTELFAVSRGLNELMGSIPGMGKAKRRVDEEIAEHEEDAG